MNNKKKSAQYNEKKFTCVTKIQKFNEHGKHKRTTCGETKFSTGLIQTIN